VKTATFSCSGRLWSRATILGLSIGHAGCFLPSFETTGEGASDGSGGQSTCESATFGEPPAASSSPIDAVNFFVAIRKIDFGEEDLSTRPGFDLDGVCTCCEGCSQTGSCTPPAGSEGRVCDRVDGGHDNGFAEFLQGLNTAPLDDRINSTALEASVISGRWTILVRVYNYNGGTNDDAVSLALYTTSGLGTEPVWDGEDPWPVRDDSLTPAGNLLDDALVKIDDAYVVGGVLVGQFRGMQTLKLTLTNQLVLDLSDAVFQAELQEVGAGFQMREGVIGGVWAIDAAFKAIGAARTDAGEPLICTDATPYDMAVHTPLCTLLDSTVAGEPACGGISVGMAFTADLVAYPVDILPFEDTSIACLAATHPAGDSCQ